MKTIKLCCVLASAFILASCSFQLYPTKTLNDNYQARMKTTEQLTAKSNVKIFLNEKDIKGDYEVISYLTYSPLTIPIFMSVEKEINKKFYEKAVMKAYELGGNGIIIMGGGYCKIITLANAQLEDAAPAAPAPNVIFDRVLMDKFISGEVSKAAKKSDIRKDESAFKSEIENNIELAKELDEVAFIREKISVLEKYNTSLAKPKASIVKNIEDLRKDLNKVEKKIKARLKREAKKAAKAAAQSQSDKK